MGVLLAAQADRTQVPGWVWLVLAAAVYFAARRLAWRLRGKDKRRVASDADWEKVLRWWGNRCALRWVGMPGRGPFLCSRGPLKKGHQIAHANYGPSSARNTYPVCAKHNPSTKESLTTWTLRRSWPVVGWVLVVRRRTWAEWLHGRLNLHLLRLRPARRRRRRR